MELSPRMYHWFVRPKWFTCRYNNALKSFFRDYNFNNKKVLDFGCGVGSSSSITNPENYIGIDCDAKRVSYARRLYPDYRFEIAIDNNISLLDKSIDIILIIAVLHHISSPEISKYLKGFRRVLKPKGKIIVMEPCFFEKLYFSNWYMACFDKGKYIRSQDEYLQIFHEHDYRIEDVKRLKKCFYNELFFTANGE